MSSVKVRFPPSPTGFCHVGTARMAVINYLFAKKRGGVIYFRSEDTDRERSRREYEDDIKEQLQWLGLAWDHFSRDTELVESHTAALSQLIAEGKAYVSEEESKKEASRMVQVVRFRNPGTVVTFSDAIRGEITFDTTELGDFVIARSLVEPLYNFSVVVNDGIQEITHIIRGEDHISNTPRQILIQEALGYPRPVYAHYPLLLGGDRSKLSKRTGDVAIRSYREKGYLPAALLNYIALLGWTPPSGKEIISLAEIIPQFELEDLHKSGAIFDVEKLRWYNREYMLALPAEDFGSQLLARLEKIVRGRGLPWDEGVAERLGSTVKERISVWEDLDAQAGEGEYDYFFRDPPPDAERLPGKGSDREAAAAHLVRMCELLEALAPEDFGDAERVKTAVWVYASEEGRAAVLWPLRVSLSGRDKSPDPFAICSIIGKDAALRRIRNAVHSLRSP